MNQKTLRVLNCLKYDEFQSILLNGTAHESYVESKWNEFRANLANFLMELDEDHYEKFVKFAEKKFQDQQQRNLGR